jgi:NADPH:quinone reductase-like Zn-dependent oxidoreductase
MKAVQIRSFGGPEVLLHEDVTAPRPQRHEVLVKVHACALNHLDLWVRAEALQCGTMKCLHIVGSDLAGEIAEVGLSAAGGQQGAPIYGKESNVWQNCVEA